MQEIHIEVLRGGGVEGKEELESRVSTGKIVLLKSHLCIAAVKHLHIVHHTEEMLLTNRLQFIVCTLRDKFQS